MNIAIWGMGISGMSTLKFLETQDHELYAINGGDLSQWKFKDEMLQLIEEDHCFSENAIPSDIKLDQIIIAPGIDKRKQIVKKFIDQGVEFISEIELAYRHLKKSIPIIALTGTNGKTTTVTMLSMVLEKSGKKVFLGGNIGTPFCDILLKDKDYDYIVLELSSFQLESLISFRANIAIILNITESHMERYSHVNEYIQAKLNIVMNQKEEDLYIGPGEFLSVPTKAKKAGVGELKEINFENSKLKGNHHSQNLYCIYKVLEHLKINDSLPLIQKVVNEFSGAPYRLQWEGELNGVTYINDGKSTNIDATLSAVKSFEPQNLTLILGGKLRSQDVSFVRCLKGRDISEIYLFGEAADLIQKELASTENIIKLDKLDDVMESIKKNKKEGVVLFSPAFPSFDLYTNYIQRGEHFKSLVNS